MIKQMYSLYDRKTQIFHNPLASASEGSAIRAYIMLTRMEKEYSEFPSDFDIYHLGQFDDAGGEVHGFKPTLVGNLAGILETTKMGVVE